MVQKQILVGLYKDRVILILVSTWLEFFVKERRKFIEENQLQNILTWKSQYLKQKRATNNMEISNNDAVVILSNTSDS